MRPATRGPSGWRALTWQGEQKHEQMSRDEGRRLGCYGGSLGCAHPTRTPELRHYRTDDPMEKKTDQQSLLHQKRTYVAGPPARVLIWPFKKVYHRKLSRASWPTTPKIFYAVLFYGHGGTALHEEFWKNRLGMCAGVVEKENIEEVMKEWELTN
eukprot:scaffold58051_cov23-Tisochrysis_lutea.AAC.1